MTLRPAWNSGPRVPGPRVRAHGEPGDPDRDDLPQDDPGPTPPVPKIPPRPLDWPPGEGVPVPDQPPAGSP